MKGKDDITEDEMVKGDAEELRSQPLDGEVAGKERPARTPGQPSKAEREAHNLTHCPPRSWCDHCVRGQAKDDAHVTVKTAAADSSIVRVILDYCFLQEGMAAKATEHDEETMAKMSMTVLVMVETLCHSIWAYAVASKGATEAWVSEQIVEDLETVGLANERLITKADQESSITDVQRSIAKARKGYGTAIEQSRVGDSNSNGKVERAIQDFKGLVRTMRSALEESIEDKTHLDDPVVPWMIRHAAHLITRSRTRENGRTAYQMMKGRRCNGKLVPFGEVVLFKIPHTQHSIGDFEDRWEREVWLGFVMRSGEHLVGTAKGVFRVSTVMRRPEDRRWSKDLLKQIGGSPEDPVPGAKGRRIPAFAKRYEDTSTDKAVFIPSRSPEVEVRVAYIYREDVEKHGPTPGCPGCTAAKKGSKYRAKHTDECRSRFERILSETDEGRKRFESARERKLDEITRQATECEEIERANSEDKDEKKATSE